MEYIVFFGVVAVIIFFIFIKAELDFRKSEKKLYESLKEQYGLKNEKDYPLGKLDKIAKYYHRFKGMNRIDDITWNDLNMDEVFKRINYAHCSAGEEYLYYLLRTPLFSKTSLDHREKLIDYYEHNEEERTKLQFHIFHLGFIEKNSIYDYLDHLNDLGERSNKKHILVIILLCLSILFSVFFPSIGMLAIITLLIMNFLLYFKEKNMIQPYIISFAYILRLLKSAEVISQMLPDIASEEKLKLETGKISFAKFKKGSFWLMSSGRMSASGNPIDIFLDYLRMALHFDLMKFNHMLSQVKSHLNEINDMISTIGYLDSMISIGEYRTSLNSWCIPKTSSSFSIIQGYHPLIANPVTNSICVDKGVLLTGSNASGKSTFLKTVAINAIYAQTIHTCLAEEYCSPFVEVYSSMALKDNLISGESYYIVEIKSIKRILNESIKKEHKILCFVDEVLRGTNTVERIAASSQILNCLAKEGVICFAATHDLELADLLKNEYDNYHFQEEIVHDDVRFSYKLFPGKATTRNAIKLLNVMGYDNDIISRAEKMAEDFLNTGVWSIKE